MNDDIAIEATGLVKNYGATRVLDGVDLRVARGSVFALLGPNGAGKTTAVRIFSTLTRPDGGRVRVAGGDVVGERHEVRRRISVTSQDATLDELLTGAENLQTMGRLLHCRDRRRAGGPGNCSCSSTSSTPPIAGSPGTRAGCAGASIWPPAWWAIPR